MFSGRMSTFILGGQRLQRHRPHCAPARPRTGRLRVLAPEARTLKFVPLHPRQRLQAILNGNN
jgi:hypothetical protein